MRSTLALGALLLASPAVLGDEPIESVCHLDGFETPVRCVTLEVPLDYSAPQARSITITAAVAPALTARPAPDPLFVFAGGPGQAGTDIAPWLETAFRPTRRARDVVLLDFRGTGRSGALRCDVSMALSGDSVELMRQAGDACAARVGADGRFYTHREVVEDIERVRLALGYEQINLWGGSFGTRIAQHYVRAHGAHVRSVVLDGATPVGQSIFASAPATVESALERLFADCANDAACVRAFPSLRDDLADLLARAESKGIAAEVANPRTGEPTPAALDRDAIVNLLRGALYVRMTRAVVPFALAAAARGDLAPLLALGVATGEWSTETMALGFTLGIMCSEDVVQTSADDRPASAAGLLRDSYYRGFAAACEAWPATPLPPAMLAPLRTATPALAISGEADPVTPPMLGDATLAQFATQVHVIVPGGFHTNSANPCVADIISAFLEEPTRGGRDHDCLRRTSAPPRFYVGAAEGSQP